jgi:pyridoxal phosphatase
MLTTASHKAVSPAGIAADATDLEQFLAGPGPEAAAVLADLDGCLISGSTVLPGAAELARRVGERLWIVSNNSSDTAQTLSERLSALGLSIPARRIFLAGEQAVRDLAAAMPGAQVALFAAPPLQALATRLGLQICREGSHAEAALLARDPSFTMADLERLTRLAHRGVPLRLTNPDPFHPAADGAPVPETGALFAAVVAGVPGLHAPSGGKPSPMMIHAVLEQAGVAPDEAVFIGDTDATDGVAARAAGVPFVLLRQPSMPRPGELR